MSRCSNGSPTSVNARGTAKSQPAPGGIAAGRLTQAPFPACVPGTAIGSAGGPLASTVTEEVARDVYMANMTTAGARPRRFADVKIGRVRPDQLVTSAAQTRG